MPVATLPAVPATIAQTPAEIAIVREINRVRRAHGLHTVRVATGLTLVARHHSRVMLAHDTLSHSSFNGSSFMARLRVAGRHRRYGETLAWAPDGSHVTARVLLRLWMHSAPHRAVLMDGTLRHVGVARVRGAMGAQQGAAITADFSS
jgi:uncharacterized protein YkwD